MTKVSKLNRNGGRLVVTATCVRWDRTIVYVQRHLKVILKKKIKQQKNHSLLNETHAIILKKKSRDSNRENEKGAVAVVTL